MGIMQEFKEFAVKGNAMDMAVGIIIGASFNQVVQSLVNDVAMPPIGWVIGGVDFSELKVVLPEKGGLQMLGEVAGEAAAAVAPSGEAEQEPVAAAAGQAPQAPAATAQQAAEPKPEVAIMYGKFINTVINFLVVAMVVFLVVRFMNRLIRKREKEQAAAAA